MFAFRHTHWHCGEVWDGRRWRWWAVVGDKNMHSTSNIVRSISVYLSISSSLQCILVV